MSAADQLQGFLERTPYVRFLGFKAELEGDALTGLLPFSEHLVGNTFIPALHGGVIGAFIVFAIREYLSTLVPWWQYALGGVYVLTILYLPTGLMGIPKRIRQGLMRSAK